MRDSTIIITSSFSFRLVEFVIIVIELNRLFKRHVHELILGFIQLLYHLLLLVIIIFVIFKFISLSFSQH